MDFYTNVIQWGNYLLVREVKDGQRQISEVKYSPTLYSPVTQETGYKTLSGSPVLPRMFDTMKEAKKWVANRKDQLEIVFGNTQYPYTYIADT